MQLLRDRTQGNPRNTIDLASSLLQHHVIGIDSITQKLYLQCVQKYVNRNMVHIRSTPSTHSFHSTQLTPSWMSRVRRPSIAIPHTLLAEFQSKVDLLLPVQQMILKVASVIAFVNSGKVHTLVLQGVFPIVFAGEECALLALHISTLTAHRLFEYHEFGAQVLYFSSTSMQEVCYNMVCPAASDQVCTFNQRASTLSLSDAACFVQMLVSQRQAIHAACGQFLVQLLEQKRSHELGAVPMEVFSASLSHQALSGVKTERGSANGVPPPSDRAPLPPTSTSAAQQAGMAEGAAQVPSETRRESSPPSASRTASDDQQPVAAHDNAPRRLSTGSKMRSECSPVVIGASHHRRCTSATSNELQRVLSAGASSSQPTAGKASLGESTTTNFASAPTAALASWVSSTFSRPAPDDSAAGRRRSQRILNTSLSDLRQQLLEHSATAETETAQPLEPQQEPPNVPVDREGLSHEPSA